MPPSDLSLAAGVREGDLLAGKYRVDRILGMGGMGVVVAAHHTHLDTKVALKFLLPAMLANADAVSRFAREARAAAKITNEHVAKVLDVGTLENGAPYMVMEFLEGGDLAAWIQQRGALPVEQAVDFVLQATVAVAEAHALGIVHRDLKPANLFCLARSDGQLQIKVLDFGISKFNDVSASGSGFEATKTSSVMGSPLYMSPEQLQSPKGVDAQTDIWALGIILYELVTGRVPFLGETLADVAVKIVMQPAPPMRELRSDVPAALEAVIRRCLEKPRQRRYPTVGELAMDLLPFAPRRSRGAVERIAGIMQAAGMSPSALAMPPSPPVRETQASPRGSWHPGTMAPVGNTKAGRSGRPGKGALAGASAVGVLLAAIVAVLAGRRQPSNEPAASAVAAASGVAPASEATSAIAVAPERPRGLPPLETPPVAPSVNAAPAAEGSMTATEKPAADAAAPPPVAPIKPAFSPPPSVPAAPPRPSGEADPLLRLKAKF